MGQIKERNMKATIKNIDLATLATAEGELEQISVEQLRIENCIDVEINKDIVLHITHSPDGYLVDCYKYLAPEEDTEEHDFDADFLGNISVDNDELEPTDL